MDLILTPAEDFIPFTREQMILLAEKFVFNFICKIFLCRPQLHMTSIVSGPVIKSN